LTFCIKSYQTVLLTGYGYGFDVSQTASLLDSFKQGFPPTLGVYRGSFRMPCSTLPYDLTG
jgi:hypothetical protein